MANIVIFGGLGYVGGRATNHLYKMGHNVVSVSREGKNHLSEESQGILIETVEWDNESRLLSLCARADCIVHLAGLGRAESSISPNEAIRVNCVNTYNLLKAAIKAKVPRFIFMSTAHVYGRSLIGNVSERTLPNPLDAYGITKRTAEDFVFAASKAGQIEGVIIRLSNSFGRPMTESESSWSLLVNNLCIQAVTKNDLLLNSSGAQFCNFISLEDVCNALQHFVETDYSQLGDGLFNLGGKTMSVLQMAELVSSRAANVLSKNLLINRINTSLEKKPTKFNYGLKKIQAAGFKGKLDFSSEIDKALKFFLHRL
ncbi:SDR family oxidoreductase [Candidatus Puniceispirillum sp.]|nr:SDR family oxidoreductase [Candidatus Puniceispirillum sp.]